MSTSQASDETIAKSTKRPNDEVDTPEKRQRRFTDALTRHGKDAAFSDFEIACQGMTFPVHRLVISMHSSFFERLCKSGFKETEERRTLEYSWSDERLQEVPLGSHCPDCDGWGWFLVHAQLAVIADKYDVHGLGVLAKKLAKKQFDRHVEQSLTITCRKDIRAAADDLVEATRYVYTNTAHDDRTLRNSIMKAFQGANYRFVRYTKWDAFQELSSDIPEFAVDYVEALTGVVFGSSRHPQKAV